MHTRVTGAASRALAPLKALDGEHCGGVVAASVCARNASGISAR